MSVDAWLDDFLSGDFLPAPANTAPACRIRQAATDWATTSVTAVREADSAVGLCPTTADPRLVLGAVLDVLVARGVPVVVDRLDRALEDIGRLLRDLGVEATDAWAVPSWRT